METTTVDEAKAQINTTIPETLHHRIKLNAITHKLKLKQWIIQAFENKLAEDEALDRNL